MAFRSPENVQRNELVRFDLVSVIRAPGNTQGQQKRGYKFTEEGVSNGLTEFKSARKIWPLLELLAKIR